MAVATPSEPERPAAGHGESPSGFAAGGNPAAEPTVAEGLGFLEPFVGPWVPSSDWEPLKSRPELHTLVPLNLSWRADRSSLEINEGLLGAGEYATFGILLWNPETRQAEFLAKQIDGDLVFEGIYEPLGPKSVRRVYDVLRPDGTKDVYRETFVLTPGGGMDWTTERWVDGAFQPVSGRPGPEFHAVRPSAEPADELLELAPLIGRWRPDAEHLPEGLVRWRAREGAEDGYVSFKWGTAQRWIHFAEHRQQGGAWRVEGAGIIAWDPARRQIVYREHSDSGVALEGAIDRPRPGLFRRHYRSSAADGTTRRWLDKWRFSADETNCFEWTTTRLDDDSVAAREPYRVCRIPR